MKKLVALMGLITLGLGSAMAQESKSAFGVNINYVTEGKNVGFGVKYQYKLWKGLVAEPAFNYYLKKEGIGAWDAAVNFHYDVKVSNSFKIYPLVGFGYYKLTGTGNGGDDEGNGGVPNDPSVPPYLASEEDNQDGTTTTGSTGDFLVNLGAGLQYDLNEKFAINLDLKYQLISGFNQFAPTIGIAYKF